MFESENKLVITLEHHLRESFETIYLLREFRSGNSIADLVYTSNLNRINVLFNNYEDAYYYCKLLYRKKRISVDQLKKSKISEQKSFKDFLNSLHCSGYINFDNEAILLEKRIDLVTDDLIAIEAKLTDWKSGLKQALSYKTYANEVYVAIDQTAMKNVDKAMFRKNGVGLMTVSESNVEITIRAKKRNAECADINYYLADKFLSILKKQGQLDPSRKETIAKSK